MTGEFGPADIPEIIYIPTDSAKDATIVGMTWDGEGGGVRTVDELIDRARFLSRNSYDREIRAVVNGLTVAWFYCRYWLDNPDELADPYRKGVS